MFHRVVFIMLLLELDQTNLMGWLVVAFIGVTRTPHTELIFVSTLRPWATPTNAFNFLNEFKKKKKFIYPSLRR